MKIKIHLQYKNYSLFYPALFYSCLIAKSANLIDRPVAVTVMTMISIIIFSNDWWIHSHNSIIHVVSRVKNMIIVGIVVMLTTMVVAVTMTMIMHMTQTTTMVVVVVIAVVIVVG